MAGAPLLSVRDVALRFGGIVALDGVSFDLDRGQILGLIGPNGAGKTTLFNCLTRLYTPTAGDILFEGRSILDRAAAPHRRARHRPHLPERRAVPAPDGARQRAGRRPHAHDRSDFVSDALRLPGRCQRARSRRHDGGALAPGSRSFSPTSISSTSPTAPSRACRSARRSASSSRARSPRGPKLLLLDEPAGGLNHDEVGALGGLIRQIRDDRGVTVLLVEHHMSLSCRSPTRSWRSIFGRKIAEGTPARVQRGAGGDPRLSRDRRNDARSLEVRGSARRPTATCACCTGSTSRSRRAASRRCSAPTAPARPRRCARSAA